MAIRPENAVDKFITRWQSAGGSERANYQLFVHELCNRLELPTPDPAREDTRDNAYVFERRVTFRHGDGTESPGFIDCYRRAAFVLEAKKVKRAVWLDPLSLDPTRLSAKVTRDVAERLAVYALGQCMSTSPLAP
jgi:hypothetical protein